MKENNDANKIPLPNPNHQETNPNCHIANPSFYYDLILEDINKFNENLSRLTDHIGELKLEEARKVSARLNEIGLNISFINKYFVDFVLKCR